MQEKRPQGAFLLCGRGDRIRTYDPLVPNQMRYQTALHPDAVILLDSKVNCYLAQHLHFVAFNCKQ